MNGSVRCAHARARRGFPPEVTFAMNHDRSRSPPLLPPSQRRRQGYFARATIVVPKRSPRSAGTANNACLFSSLVISLKHSYNMEAPHYKQPYNLHEEIGALTLRMDNTEAFSLSRHFCERGSHAYRYRGTGKGGRMKMGAGMSKRQKAEGSLTLP